MKKYVLKLLVSLIIICFSFSQEGYISGYILDENSNPLPGCNVYFYGNSFGTASNSDGYFKIENLEEGKYTLIVDFIGYQQGLFTFYISEFSSDENQIENEYLSKLGIDIDSIEEEVQKKMYFEDIQINLQPDPIGADEVTVSAAKFKQKVTQAPSVVEVINQKAIRRNIGTYNFNKLISTVKGIDVHYFGVHGAQINARGFDGAFNTRFRQLNDGVNMGEIITGLVYSSATTPPKESISKIDVVFGPQAALYGPDAAQGLSNIIPKHPRYDTENEINLSLSNRSKYRLGGRYAKIINESSAVDLSFELLNTKEFPYGNIEKDSDGNFINPLIFNLNPENPESHGDTLYEDFYSSMNQYRNSLRVGYFYSLDNGDEINLTSNVFSSSGLAMGSYGVYYLELLSNITSLKYNSQNHSFRYSLISQDGIFKDRPIISSWQTSCQSENSELPTYYHDCDSRPPSEQMNFEEAWESFHLSEDNWKIDVDGVDQFIDYQYNNIIGNNQIVAGFDFEFKNPNSHRTVMYDQGYDYFTKEDNIGEDIYEYRYGIYGQFSRNITNKLGLTASLRYDGHEFYKNTFSPKISLVYDDLNIGNFKFMYGKGFKAPSLLVRRVYAGKLNVFGLGNHIVVYGNNSGFDITVWEDKGNGIWDEGEIWIDSDSSGFWDFGEDFIDLGDGKLNDGESVYSSTHIPKLDLEEVNSFEIAYTKLLSKNTIVEINGYSSEFKNPKPAAIPIMVAYDTSYVPQNIASSFGGTSYQYSIIDGEGNNKNGYYIMSYINNDISVNFYGLDLGIRHKTDRIELKGNLSYFNDSELNEKRKKAESGNSKYKEYKDLYSNTSNYKWNLVATIFDFITYGLDLSVMAKGNKAFDFKSGFFIATADGKGSSYGQFDNWQQNNGQVGGGYVIDLNSIYKLNNNIQIGFSVTNLFESQALTFPLSPKQVRSVEMEIGYKF